MGNRFTEKAEKTLNHAVSAAQELGHTYIGTEHALIALLVDSASCAAILLGKNGIKKDLIENAVREYSGTGMKTALTAKDTTPRFRRIIENSYKAAQKYSSEKIGTEHILLALLDERGSTAEKILHKAGFDTVSLRDETVTFLRTIEKSCAMLKNEARELSIPNLMKYGRNITEEAKNSLADPVIGRDKETERLIRILSRKTKNNPCLIGEAGVGKTAIVEGLAQRIVNKDVPEALFGKTIISIDLSAMVAGAKYRGDFEDRIKNILSEAKENKSVILFIDEVHTIVGAGSAEGAIDAANILKPALSRGEIHLIGATTLAEYKKYIESDNALERRFQPVTVEEPTPEEALDILYGLKPRYEEYHDITITDDALRAALRLSRRYIKDRFLPDKAIDVLDEACAKANVYSRKGKIKLKKDKKSEQKQLCEEYPDFDMFFYKDNSTSKLGDELPVVNAQSIAEVVSEMTGIPVESRDFDEYRDFYFRLEKHIAGQSDAVRAVSDAVVRGLAGIGDENRPKGVFLFVGQSGVGKTELARALACELFGNADSLLRYDMSEFSEKQSVAKFIGSSPGYVGYNEATSITDTVRRKPYSVILFDEIEKASEDVINLFLQIADTGTLTDSSGRRADFRNSYIIMTSNVGAEGLSDKEVGFVKKEKSDALFETLRESFSEEFLNRLDDIILFRAQNSDTMREIAEKKMREFLQRLEAKGIFADFDSGVIDYILNKCSNRTGARAISRVIAAEIETPIAKLILSSDGIADERIKIKTDGKEIILFQEEALVTNE